MLDLCLTWAAGGATTSGGGRAAQSAWHMTGPPPPPHQLEATPRPWATSNVFQLQSTNKLRRKILHETIKFSVEIFFYIVILCAGG